MVLHQDILVLVDFNNDNTSDIAVVNEETNTFVVLFGLGDESFVVGLKHSTGIRSAPLGLAVDDFDNDTRLDIVVANTGANNIRAFLAYDSQPFGSIMILFAYQGSQPRSIAVNDLNSDDCLDAVIANYVTDNLNILLGNGDETFQIITKYLSENDSALSSVAIADFNNDPYLDILVENSQTDNIAILLGAGNGMFGNGMSYSTGIGSYPYTVTTGDFNNEKITDIAVANSGANNIFLLYGYEDGTFVNQTSYHLGYNYRPDSIAVKDLNHDNWLDIVTVCHDTDHVENFIKICP